MPQGPAEQRPGLWTFHGISGPSTLFHFKGTEGSCWADNMQGNVPSISRLLSCPNKAWRGGGRQGQGPGLGVPPPAHHPFVVAPQMQYSLTRETLGTTTDII